jgi:hypothetical protein
MQVELLNRKPWSTRIELASAIFDYLEIFHNRQRRHSSLSMLMAALRDFRLRPIWATATRGSEGDRGTATEAAVTRASLLTCSRDIPGCSPGARCSSSSGHERRKGAAWQAEGFSLRHLRDFDQAGFSEALATRPLCRPNRSLGSLRSNPSAFSNHAHQG